MSSHTAPPPPGDPRGGSGAYQGSQALGRRSFCRSSALRCVGQRAARPPRKGGRGLRGSRLLRGVAPWRSRRAGTAPSWAARPGRYARTPSGSGHGRGLRPALTREVRPIITPQRDFGLLSLVAQSTEIEQRSHAFVSRSGSEVRRSPLEENRDRENEAALAGLQPAVVGRACRGFLRAALTSDSPMSPPSTRSSQDWTRQPSRASRRKPSSTFKRPRGGRFTLSWAPWTRQPKASGPKSWRPTTGPQGIPTWISLVGCATALPSASHLSSPHGGFPTVPDPSRPRHQSQPLSKRILWDGKVLGRPRTTCRFAPRFWTKWSTLGGLRPSTLGGRSASSTVLSQIYVDDPAFAIRGTLASAALGLAVTLARSPATGYPLAWQALLISIPETKCAHLLDQTRRLLTGSPVISRRELRSHAGKVSSAAGLVPNLEHFTSGLLAVVAAPNTSEG